MAAKNTGGTKKVKVLSVKGASSGDITLPAVFDTPFRPDLIQRAVISEQSYDIQPYGPNERAGLNTSADYYGRRREYYRLTVNRGMSRLPRVKTPGGGLGKVLRVPHSKGGRRAHGPKPEKIYVKRMNKKEWQLALDSAIAATTDASLASAEGRNHKTDGLTLPLIIEGAFEKLAKTKDILSVLNGLGLAADLERASEKKNLAGRGKARGRRTKTKKSVLIVVSGECKALEAAENIAGVDVVALDELNVALLAPGGFPGRLTLWTEPALKRLEESQ